MAWILNLIDRARAVDDALAAAWAAANPAALVIVWNTAGRTSTRPRGAGVAFDDLDGEAGQALLALQLRDGQSAIIVNEPTPPFTLNPPTGNRLAVGRNRRKKAIERGAVQIPAGKAAAIRKRAAADPDASLGELVCDELVQDGHALVVRGKMEVDDASAVDVEVPALRSAKRGRIDNAAPADARLPVLDETQFRNVLNVGPASGNKGATFACLLIDRASGVDVIRPDGETVPLSRGDDGPLRLPAAGAFFESTDETAVARLDPAIVAARNAFFAGLVAPPNDDLGWAWLTNTKLLDGEQLDKIEQVSRAQQRLIDAAEAVWKRRDTIAAGLDNPTEAALVEAFTAAVAHEWRDLPDVRGELTRWFRAMGGERSRAALAVPHTAGSTVPADVKLQSIYANFWGQVHTEQVIAFTPAVVAAITGAIEVRATRVLLLLNRSPCKICTFVLCRVLAPLFPRGGTRFAIQSAGRYKGSGPNARLATDPTCDRDLAEAGIDAWLKAKR